MTRKSARVLSRLMFLLLISMIFSVNKVVVSAAPISPYIMVVPEETVDPAVAPGMNYTISVYTDHSVNNVTAWEFSLTFNPSVLQMGFNITDTWTGDGATATFTTSREAVVEGSEKVYVNQVLMTRDVDYQIIYGPFFESQIVFNTAPSIGAEVKAEYEWTGLANGDLITTAKNPSATFIPGTFDNAQGKLSLTTAFFFYMSPPPPITSGPGTLANVTFGVVGYGVSDIILGQDTKLYAPGQPPFYSPPYVIIDASKPPDATSPPYGSDHIGNGHFENIHDVAIIRLITPATVIQGDTMSINVTVANGGDVTRTFNITVFANTTLIGNQTVNNLAEGDLTTVLFNWNTTTMTAGNYVINATAWLPPEDDPKDNTKTATAGIKTLHDVAIISLEIPDEANAGDFLSINVTVANQGTFEENINLTIYYRPEILHPPPPAVMNTTTFTLGKRPTSTTIQTNWNTTGLDNASYNMTATIIVDNDEDPSDNTLSKSMTLNKGHDVSIIGVLATSKVFVGETVTISVTVQNVGGLNETLVEVMVSCGTEASSLESIGPPQQIPSLNVRDSVTLTFVWSTADLNPEISQTYLIEAEAILDKDEDPTNNRGTDTVAVASPRGAIVGIVEDASGNPIAGVTVTCGTYTNTTNADGSYRLSNVLAGNYAVIASKNGYQASSQTSVTVVAGQTTELNFSLTPLPTTGYVAGIVTDNAGNPIEGAQVSAGDKSVSTNSTGGYSIELPAGTYDITVSANGYEGSSEADVHVVAGATTTVDFMLNPNQPLNVLPYVAAALVIIVVIVGIAIYLQKRKKAT